VIKLELLEKETKPPARYTQGSIIKELEKRNLGTRATRSEILQTLYDRGYIRGKSIEVTPLGEVVVNVLNESCPRILSEELTRHFEQEMELVYEGKKKKEEVIEEAKRVLAEILNEFKSKQENIGKKLLEGFIAARRAARTLGKCKCGGDLIMRVSRATGKLFCGCSNYPRCDVSYPLPQAGRIEKTGKVCEHCGTPIVRVFRKGKRPFSMCLTPTCASKSGWGKKT
jgi:DNA topoisomerase-1